MCHIQDDQVTNLTHLALGYSHNLGLTRIPTESLRLAEKENSPQDTQQNAPTTDDHSTHSLEEQKAFLGTFCVLSA